MISQETYFLTDDSLSIHFNDRVWRGMGIGLTTKKKFTQKNTSRMYLFIVMAFKYEKAGLDISLNVLLCQHKKNLKPSTLFLMLLLMMMVKNKLLQVLPL